MNETQSTKKKEELNENLKDEPKASKQKQKKSFDVDLGIPNMEDIEKDLVGHLELPEEKKLEEHLAISEEKNLEEHLEFSKEEKPKSSGVVSGGIERVVRTLTRKSKNIPLSFLSKKKERKGNLAKRFSFLSKKTEGKSSDKPSVRSKKTKDKPRLEPSYSEKRRGRKQNVRPVFGMDESRKVPSFNLPFLKEKSKHRLRMAYLIITSQSLRLAIGGSLFLVALYADFSGNHDPETIVTLFLIPYVLLSLPVFLRILINLGKRKLFDENLLVLLATLGAFYIEMHWESVGVLLMYQVVRLVESIVLRKTKRSIAENLDIKSQTANLKRGNIIEVVPPEKLKLRQTIVIGPGEKIPVDAVVTAGKSTIDTKALTGESEPVEVKVGHKIFSGCINLGGVLEARVLKRYAESTAVKILELVDKVEEKKPDQERSMEFFMRYYTPGAIGASFIIMLLPPLVLPDQDTYIWLVRALTFLIAACPCGLLASIPLAYLGGVGAALRQGILVKGALYLERLARAETFLLDKTGTLTEGIFRVKKIATRKIPSQELLRIAAYGEVFSSHPIAVSLRKAYGRRINTKKVTNMVEESGFGVSGNVEGMEVIIGSSHFLGEFGIFSHPVSEVGTAVHVAIDGEYAGYILLADHPREDVYRLIRWLQRRKHEVVILSGDNERVVNDIAQQLGIKTAFSSLMPEDKMDYLNIYQESQLGEGHVVFVGDGLNDAPVLAAADVGIGMGGLGADAALEAADIVLLEDEPSKIINAIRIAKSVRRTIRYNLILVMLMKVILLGLAVMGLITMGRAVVVDVGVMLILMLNSFWLVKHPERNK